MVAAGRYVGRNQNETSPGNMHAESVLCGRVDVIVCRSHDARDFDLAARRIAHPVARLQVASIDRRPLARDQLVEGRFLGLHVFGVVDPAIHTCQRRQDAQQGAGVRRPTASLLHFVSHTGSELGFRFGVLGARLTLVVLRNGEPLVQIGGDAAAL